MNGLNFWTELYFRDYSISNVLSVIWETRQHVNHIPMTWQDSHVDTKFGALLWYSA